MEDFFKDLLIVELASVLAGPAVGMFFAELGARVIKIENKKTGGDVTRKWKLPVEDPAQEYSAYYHSVNWGKETQLLDLNIPPDKSYVMELVRRADIVISNFKPDSAIQLEMDYPSLQRVNPSLIYGAITAYGDDSAAPGFDAMIQAETGWLSMNGEKNGSPVKLPVALMDILAAHQLKQGLLMALLKRERTGKGSLVSVSLFDASIAALANQASNWLNANHLPQRTGSQHPNIAPYGDVFSTKDQVEIILGTGTQKQFEGLCTILGLDFLNSDRRFLTNALRVANRLALNTYLKDGIAKYTFVELKEACDKTKVTLAPINDLEVVFNSSAASNLVLKEIQVDGSLAKCVRTAVFKLS